MRHTAPPRTLADDEYDVEGMPLAPVSLTRCEYLVAYGPIGKSERPRTDLHSCWLARYDDLPGYYGEGRTMNDALVRLRQSLGPRPHFQVAHKIRKSEKLKADIERKHKAERVARRMSVGLFPKRVAGGDHVAEEAKSERIRKATLDEARVRLDQDVWPSAPECLVAGLSKESLRMHEDVVPERIAMDIWVAEQTPWRVEHATAREKFPQKSAD